MYGMRYHHIGIPTTKTLPEEDYIDVTPRDTEIVPMGLNGCGSILIVHSPIW